MKINLKPIFATPIIFISFLRKIKLNGFMGGIVIGALFSMIVNIVTVQVQELINRQRILEAVEWEIYNNAQIASSVLSEAKNIVDRDDRPSPYYSFRLYNKDFWDQSIEPMLYIAQLDPEVSSSVVTYFKIRVNGSNEMIKSTQLIADKVLSDCYTAFGEVNNEKMIECKSWYHQLVLQNAQTAGIVGEESFNLLHKFHPTEDRLNNWFLRLMMGDKSVRVLSGI